MPEVDVDLVKQFLKEHPGTVYRDKDTYLLYHPEWNEWCHYNMMVAEGNWMVYNKSGKLVKVTSDDARGGIVVMTPEML